MNFPFQLFFEVWQTGLALFALVYPFVALCRGARFLKTILLAWGLLVFYVFLMCGVLPLVIWHYDKAVSYKLGDLGFDGPSVVIATGIGWIYPFVAATAGYGCRSLAPLLQASGVRRLSDRPPTPGSLRDHSFGAGGVYVINS